MGIVFEIVFLSLSVIEICPIFHLFYRSRDLYPGHMTPEVEPYMFIVKGVVDYVGIGFKIVFLSLSVLEICPFSTYYLGHVTYIRVT